MGSVATEVTGSISTPLSTLFWDTRREVAEASATSAPDDDGDGDEAAGIVTLPLLLLLMWLGIIVVG